MTVTRHNQSAHMSATLHLLRRARELKNKQENIVLDGNNLDISTIVSVARHGVEPTISDDEAIAKRLDLSVQTLADNIAQECVIYGVNTGFGGSADTRTKELVKLQTHLLQFIQSG